MDKNGWRPIETAPRNGWILVSGYIYNDPAKGRWMEVAEWNGEGFSTEQCPLHPPTHWMPLPEPPDA